MKILALNCGSATVKFQLFETAPESMLARGSVDAAPNHEAAIETLLERINGATIDGVGHRVVHGGEYYSESVLIDEEVERRIEECAELAPLHNPHNLTGYRAVRKALPHCPNVAVFDTAFHQTIPREAYLYGLPYEFYRDDRIRRYGFHGTSHRYVSQRYAELKGGDVSQFRLIVCHLGNGASVCAIDRGRSVDVSLGFTPLEGLVMGTRTGDLDPGVVLYLMERKGMSSSEANTLLNKQSGLLGLSGITHDVRVLTQKARGGDERAQLALGVFCHRVKRYVGAFHAVLNGADAVIFTGGIGENSAEVRSRCCESLDALGIVVDDEKNRTAAGKEMAISASDTEVWVIPTNEELLIARETVRCIQAIE